jgi:hypothetical protein
MAMGQPKRPPTYDRTDSTYEPLEPDHLDDPRRSNDLDLNLVSLLQDSIDCQSKFKDLPTQLTVWELCGNCVGTAVVQLCGTCVETGGLVLKLGERLGQ